MGVVSHRHPGHNSGDMSRVDVDCVIAANRGLTIVRAPACSGRTARYAATRSGPSPSRPFGKTQGPPGHRLLLGVPLVHRHRTSLRVLTDDLDEVHSPIPRISSPSAARDYPAAKPRWTR